MCVKHSFFVCPLYTQKKWTVLIKVITIDSLIKITHIFKFQPCTVAQEFKLF